MFANFVASNQLTIVNTLDICQGSTTWTKIREGKQLKSTIDFFVVCKRVLPHVQGMIIDNDKQHRITNFFNIKKGKNTTDADHTTMWMKINMKIAPEKPDKVELINFKDTDAQKLFKTNTDQTDDFTKCTESDQDFTRKAEMWKHLLNKHCRQSFKKIRIRKQYIRPSKANKLINERQKQAKKNTDENSEEIKELDLKIAEMIAEEERAKCVQFKQFGNQNGSVNMPEMWKLKKKLWPKKAPALPAAKINHKGKLVSTAAEVKHAIHKEYTERLRKRPKHPQVSKLYKKKTIEMKLTMSKKNKSKPFQLKELEMVLSKL